MTRSIVTRICLTLPLLASCGGDDEGSASTAGCEGAKCDDPNPEDFACQSVQDFTGRAPGFVEGLDDPVARFLLKRGKTCPSNLDEIMAKLREEDTEGCEGGGRAGLASRLVSERSQLLGKADSMRAVINRTCGGRQEHELLLSVFGIDGANATRLPQNNNELIGFDATNGVFNYYTLEGGQWAFHGDSLDFIQGVGGRCKGCHTGGGLIMKELDAPWVHWEGDTTTVGARELVERIEDLGQKFDGINMESITRAGNDRWNLTRIERTADPDNTALHGGSTRELLRPLFCATEFNLQSVGGPVFGSSGPSRANGLRSDFLIDPTFSVFTSPQWDPADYEAVAAEVGQRVQGIPGATDTFFPLTFVERAGGDMDYVSELTKQGIVDFQFIQDVLVIDHTRPVFSDERCALLEFAPDFSELEDDPGGGGSTGGADDGGGSSDSGGSTSGGTGGAVDPGNCCEARSMPGCEVPSIESCVCAADSFCCNNEFDDICVNVATDTCMAACQAIERAFEPGVKTRRAAGAPTSEALRKAMLLRLEAASLAPGSAAEQLRDNLAAADQDHGATVESFLAACKARAENRGAREFIRDVLTVAAARRARAEKFNGSLEFAETMVTDDLSPSPNAHFDPATCEVVQ